MTVELVTTRTSDGVELDGALYAASTDVKGVAVLMVHGLTWNFYRGPSRWLPPLLARTGFACLSLNMRDHDLAEPKEFEKSHLDVRAGMDLLEARGAEEVVVLAHGYACNKAVAYAAQSGDLGQRRLVLTTLGAVKAYRPDIWEQVLAAAGKLAGQALVVQGEVDPLIEARARANELAVAAPAARIKVVMLEGADHYFNGRHDQLAECVVGWLQQKGEAG